MILTRYLDQSIMIGDDITITLLGINGQQAKLGIDAPKDVSVHRREIYDRIQKEKQQGIEGNK